MLNISACLEQHLSISRCLDKNTLNISTCITKHALNISSCLNKHDEHLSMSRITLTPLHLHLHLHIHLHLHLHLLSRWRSKSSSATHNKLEQLSKIIIFLKTCTRHIRNYNLNKVYRHTQAVQSPKFRQYQQTYMFNV